MSKFVAALALVAAMLFPTFASAQSFTQHYQETVLNFNNPSGEIQYLAIPRAGWPVHVQISAVDVNIRPFTVTNFVVVDTPFAADNPMMTMASTPLSMATSLGGSMATICSYPAPLPPAAAECQLTSEISVGVTDSASVQPHRIFIRTTSGPIQFRIIMWY